MVEADLVDDHALRLHTEQVGDAALEADRNVAEADGAMAGIEQRPRDDPDGVREVDDPGVRAGELAHAVGDLQHHRHGAHRLREPAGAGRLLADAAAGERDRLIAQARRLPADADLHEHEVRAFDRTVEVGREREITAPAGAVEHARREPADDVEPLVVHVHQRERVDRHVEAAQPRDRGAIDVEPVAPLSLKGKAQVVPAYRLLRVVEGAAAFERRLDTPLVGRHEQLARLRASVRCRHLRAVLPARHRSRAPGDRQIAARHRARGGSGGGGGCAQRQLSPVRGGNHVLAAHRDLSRCGAETELGTALSAGTAEEIFWSVRKAFERRSRHRPLALVVEDIHWAEPTLLDLLEHLVYWTRDAPIFLLCLARPELLDERPAWGGHSQAGVISLEPLSQAESDELITTLVAGSRLEEGVRDRIYETAEGNPLFVEQLLAGLTEGRDGEDLPPTIHALLAARLDALPDEERDVLERASVVGMEFEWEALTALAPDRGRPPGACLATLVRKELIRPHEVIEDAFRFRHMLIRDAAYERITKELRSGLHERFARLARRPG